MLQYPMFAAVLLQGLTCLRIHLASMYPLLVVMCLCPHPIKTQYHTTNIKIVLHKINFLLLLFSNILLFNSLKMRKKMEFFILFVNYIITLHNFSLCFILVSSFGYHSKFYWWSVIATVCFCTSLQVSWFLYT